MAVTVTHSKTLVSPSTGSEDKVYGADYVAPDSHNLNGLGTGVETALGVNVGSAGAFVTLDGALGTPSSGTATNLTGLPLSGIVNASAESILIGRQSGSAGAWQEITLGTNLSMSGTTLNASGSGSSAFNDLTSGTNTTAAMVVGTGATLGASGSGAITATAVPVGGVSGMGTGVGTFLATPSSANLASAVTDETGSGALVFATSPTLVTPALGTPASGTLTNCTGLPVAGGGTGATTKQAATSNLAAVYILNKNGVPITAPANDTNNNVIETISVSAGIIGNNGALRYFCRTTLSNNANAKTIRVYIGASGAGTGGTLIGSHSVANTQQSTIEVLVSNSNAANVQETTVIGQTNINVISTRVAGAIDTSSAWELVIAFQKATGTDTMTLQHSVTELLSDGT